MHGYRFSAPIRCPVNGDTAVVMVPLEDATLCWCQLSGIVCSWPPRTPYGCPLTHCTCRPEGAAWACPATYLP